MGARLVYNPFIMDQKIVPAVNRADALLRLLRERIVILDGAMGTMIQTYRLDEAAYRGEAVQGLAARREGQ